MKINIMLQATYCNNRWPQLKIYNNGIVLDDYLCNQTHIILEYDVVTKQDNQLKLEFYNKCFGDGGIWDVSNSGEMKLKLVDLAFDDVSIDHLIHTLEYETNWTPNQLIYEPQESIKNYSKYCSNGIMSFNGCFIFEYSMPIYNFLINKKYKKQYNSNLAYFSNYTESFHYETGIDKIAEIRKIIKTHD